ncbi:uncharacterized protein LOC131688024 [Topomyia yanbarensis]|uniref:uncharacterized protein LOC131688024 n=1 Tax=Topomyia yanbarensis TaxID=2498891 RepID=UPI00273C8A97|nr:uncharacterized protein LOC131688024 [Topomyia yanbarensis]
MNSSYQPMDLRIAKHSDNISNAYDDIENQYEDDVSEEEEDAEGDPTLLNDFSIFECFEKYRNMITDDEEFSNSEDEYDFQRDRRSEKLKSKITAVDDEHSILHLDEKKNGCNNTTHHILEKELHEPKKKEMTLRKRNKLLRMKGMSYTRSDGTVVPARSTKEGCHCRLECAKKYSEAVRKQLLQNVLDLNLSGQNQFIANHMVVTKTARPKLPDPNQSPNPDLPDPDQCPDPNQFPDQYPDLAHPLFPLPSPDLN